MAGNRLPQAAVQRLFPKQTFIGMAVALTISVQWQAVRFQLRIHMSRKHLSSENNLLARNVGCPVRQLIGQGGSLLDISVVYY